MTTTEGSTTYEYDAANRLTSMGGVPYTWDARGNLLNDGTFTYAYNSAGRVVRAESVTATLVYTYTASGLRVAQSVDGVETSYAWDWAAGVPEMLSEGTNLYLVGHNTLGRWDGSEWAYHLPDALGSVRQVVDRAGAVVSAREWTPYGVEVGGAQAGLGYTGEWWDAGVGMEYLRARWYAPTLGRFTRRDQWEGVYSRPLTGNPYLYALQNPVNMTDPSGFTSIGPGFIERQVTLNVHPFVLSAGGPSGGTGSWLEAATELEVVKEVYGEFRERLKNGGICLPGFLPLIIAGVNLQCQ